MGFFPELPAAEPEPHAPHQPWEPPQAELPGIVPIQTLMLGRTDRVAVAVTGMSAFAEGFEIFVTAHIRPAGPAGDPDPGAARRSFRFGLLLADGSKVIGEHRGRPGRGPDPGAEPQGPMLRAAGAHFALLTGGRYVRLGVGEDNSGRAVLLAIRDDGVTECPVEALRITPRGPSRCRSSATTCWSTSTTHVPLRALRCSPGLGEPRR